MYHLHDEYMKLNNSENIDLYYIDKVSFIYDIRTMDFYKDFLADL